MNNTQIASAIKSDKLSVKRIFFLTYQIIFRNILYLAPLFIINLLIIRHFKAKYYIAYTPALYLFTAEILDFVIFKRRQKGIFSFITAYMLMSLFSLLFGGFASFFAIICYIILKRGANILEAVYAFQTIYKGNFLFIFLNIFLQYVLYFTITLISSFIYTMKKINFDEVAKIVDNTAKLKVYINYLSKQFTDEVLPYEYVVMHIIIAVTVYIVYNYLENKKILKGE